MNDFHARDIQELRRFLRSDERWRGSVDEVARWLDKVFSDHASFLDSDEMIWEIAEERLFAIHGRTGGEPILDAVNEKYTELALQGSQPSRKAASRGWIARLGWFSLGFLVAVFLVPFSLYWFGKRLAKETPVEVTRQMKASPQEILAVLGDVRDWTRYDFPIPFYADDKPTYSENTTGVGATVKVVRGKYETYEATITAIEPGKSVSFEAHGGYYETKSIIRVTKTKTGSEVVWKYITPPSFLSVYFGSERTRRGFTSSLLRALAHFDLQLNCEHCSRK